MRTVARAGARMRSRSAAKPRAASASRAAAMRASDTDYHSATRDSHAGRVLPLVLGVRARSCRRCCTRRPQERPKTHPSYPHPARPLLLVNSSSATAAVGVRQAGCAAVRADCVDKPLARLTLAHNLVGRRFLACALRTAGATCAGQTRCASSRTAASSSSATTPRGAPLWGVGLLCVLACVLARVRACAPGSVGADSVATRRTAWLSQP